ncbi:MAG TPA: M1 family metallopeptidase, partial [Dongiaceae bacterium]|nr:M1 family metallopeptidase [Dongiaceae bacterium]
MPGPLYWQQRVDYDIRASLDTATHTIAGEETIRYTNNSPDTLRYLWLQLDMNQGAADNRFTILQPAFRASEPGFAAGATIERVNALRQGAAQRGRARPAPASSVALTWRVNATMMRVDLDQPLPPRTTLSLDIAWHHQVPPGGRTGRRRYSEGWLYNVAQWYPRLAVYDDVRGWNTEQYLGSGEFYLEYGDFTYALTLPADYTVTGSGVLQNPQQVLTAEQRSRLALALHSDTTVHVIRLDEAGTAGQVPPGAGATRTWHFKAQNVRDVAWAAAPHFVWDASGWDGVLIQALYPTESKDVWRTAADMTRQAIRIHSRWFHYPYPTAISINGPAGGMEYPMITFDDAENEVELYYTIAHEQGHEWFPMIVGSNERLHGWMDEGFNTFIDLFSFRDRYPNDTTRIQSLEFGSLRAWLQFLHAWRGQETPIDEPQDRSTGGGVLSGWQAYGKPGVGLHWLREQVVDSTAFDAAFREYARRWAYRHPTPADFFRTMNDALGEDLNWFWRSWFLRSDHLDLAVDSVVQRTLRDSVTTLVRFERRLEMPAPMELRITGADGSVRTVRLPVEVWFRGSQAIWQLRTTAA